ncbi:MAG: hypothetical protein KatS3mg057_0162 [Herpetosiphonaceae bacterium]|nr:MAG: hypothetical protein KatS3mg057_0162 [Herpetosiphonaceae bacterium]
MMLNSFYSYGMALREIGLPEVEYPSGALLPWAMLSWMSGNSREAFALLFPMLNIACDMLIVAALLWLLRAARSSAHAPSTVLAAAPAGLYAFAPLLEPFVFAKYDSLPAALALGGLALFAARRPGLAGAALGLGATIKWTPLLAAPLLALHLIRERNWRELVLFTAGLLVSAAATSLPFALTNPAAFLLAIPASDRT